MSLKNLETVKQIYAAYTRADATFILNHLSEDVDWGTDSVVTEIPWYAIRRGRDAVKSFFTALVEHVEVSEFTPGEYMESPSHVAVCLTFNLKLKKNGKRVTMRAIHLWTFDDRGRVLRYRAFEDTAAIEAAWRG